MATDVGSGALADRLRAFLRLTGRIPLKMDEMVVPVVVGQNLDLPPWRTSDQNFSVFINGATPGAGFFGAVGVEMPARTQGVARVTQVLLNNASAAALSYDIRVGPRGTTNYTRQGNVFNTELMNPVPALIPTLTPEYFDFSENPLATGWLIGRVRLAADSSIVVPVDVALRGNYGNSSTTGQSLMVFTRTAATQPVATISGTFYPQAL